MCIIIIKQQSKALSADILKRSAKINPHGLGVVWLDNYSITYHKSKEWDVLQTKRPFIAHFRYATVGKIGPSNTHPFPCGERAHEYLMMNGTISGLGNVNDCDSKVLARELGSVPRRLWREELERFVCRFVTVDTKKRTWEMYNDEMWTLHEGVYYSKDNVLHNNLVAVYGTLKKGHGNYRRLLLDDSSFIGHGHTAAKYPLVVNGLPYLVDAEGVGHNVRVDLFAVSDSKLDELDRLEGHPNWYRRRMVDVEVGGKTHRAWIYFCDVPYEGAKLHKSYEHEPYRPKQAEFSWKQFLSETVDDSTKTGTPVCSACYSDAKHDGFCNYYCSNCDSWYTEQNILMI